MLITTLLNWPALKPRRKINISSSCHLYADDCSYSYIFSIIMENIAIAGADPGIPKGGAQSEIYMHTVAIQNTPSP